MKEFKPLRPGPAEPDLAPSGAGAAKTEVRGLAEPRPIRPSLAAAKRQSTMQTNMPTRKSPGRLNRETMKLLGKVLGDYFDHVRQQEVPEHITNLVKQYEERKDKESI
jgi:hypothetical protein